MSKDLDVIEGQVEFLKGEILEYRLYIEICAITILFIVILFFGTSSGINQLKTNLLGRIIMASVVIILGLMIFMFSRVVYISKFKVKSVLNNRKMLLQDWIK